MHEHGVGGVETSKTLEADSRLRMMQVWGRLIDNSFPCRIQRAADATIDNPNPTTMTSDPASTLSLYSLTNPSNVE